MLSEAYPVKYTQTPDVKKAYQLVSFLFIWCREPESNRHAVASAGF